MTLICELIFMTLICNIHIIISRFYETNEFYLSTNNVKITPILLYQTMTHYGLTN